MAHAEDCSVEEDFTFKTASNYPSNMSLRSPYPSLIASVYSLVPPLLQFLTHQHSHVFEDNGQFTHGTRSGAISGGDIEAPQPFATQIQYRGSNINVDANNLASILN